MSAPTQEYLDLVTLERRVALLVRTLDEDRRMFREGMEKFQAKMEKTPYALNDGKDWRTAQGIASSYETLLTHAEIVLNRVESFGLRPVVKQEGA